MADSTRRPRHVSPQSRALRRVVRSNEDIAYQLRRIMGLKETDYTAMALLMYRPMGPGELARALHITSAAATVVVDRLVRAGHVQREPHPEDRRRTIIRPTADSTQRVMEHVYPVMGMVEEHLARLDPAGQAAVLSFLDATADSLEDYHRELTARAADGPSEPPDRPEGAA